MTDITDIKALREALCKLKSVEGVRTLAAELIDQLEAERQRADAADSRLHEVSVHCANVEAETAALKTDIESYISINGELATEVEALKAKLANPVVLPDLVTNALQSNKPFSLFDIIRATQHGDAEAIIAAGFTVKGE